MALRKILTSKVETPYGRPPPVHICLVGVRDQPKVVSWVFEESGGVTPAVTKNNKVAVISDGQSLIKTTLYQECANRLTEKQGYMMRGYSLRGQSPPYDLIVTRETQFFRSAPVEVSQALVGDAQALLYPPSTLTHLANRDARGLLTVECEVVEVSTIKRISVGKDAVPLRMVTLEQDKTRVAMSLWREAALLPIDIGKQVRITHMKASVGAYGYRLQSTNCSVLEETTTTDVIGDLGAIQVEGRPGLLKLLVEDEKMLEIEESLWLPLEKKFKKVPFYLKIKASGKMVIEAEAFEGEVAEAKS